jgi:hypothetical protein
MRIDGVAALIDLECDASLRVEPGARVEICCLSGSVWVTQEGNPRDMFFSRAESLVLSVRGVTVVTALEPAMLRLSQRRETAVALLGFWGRWAPRMPALLKPCAAVVRG